MTFGIAALFKAQGLDEMINAGVLKFASGAISIVNVEDAENLRFNAGTPVHNDGTLVVSADDPTRFLGGLGYDNVGALCCDPTDPITSYVAGLPLTAKGALAINTGFPPVVRVSGIPIDVSGRVCTDLPT
jgi:hypothetical protein